MAMPSQKPRSLLRDVLFFAGGVLAQNPYYISYDAQNSFGPDGPWQALPVSIGGQDLYLYPGASYGPRVFSPAACDNVPTDQCLAAQSGIYDETTSASANTSVNDIIEYNNDADVQGWDAPDRFNMTGQTHIVLDTLSVRTADGVSLSVDDAGILVMDQSSVRMPNGNTYNTQVGFMGLGQNQLTQSLGGVDIHFLGGNLRDDNDTASHSFGLHIGSARYNQSASLVLGGYDRSRVVGPVGTRVMQISEPAQPNPIAPLVDLSIEVEQGSSPFNDSAPIGSVFSARGAARPNIIFDATLPYMFLPFGLCEAVATHLPVTYLPGPGLYAWNTDSPDYERIVQSSASLAFTFAMEGSQSLIVKVPFGLLNLTLESPIVDSPVAYFPCKPSPAAYGSYYLGRAFLQAAYLSILWDSTGDGPRFFLAQAPGPGAASQDVRVIRTDATDFNTLPASTFAESWAQTWNIYNSDGTTSDGSSDGSGSSLGGGAIAGVVIGALAAIAVAAFLVWFLIIRKKRRAAAAAAGGASAPGTDAQPHLQPGTDGQVGQHYPLASYKDHQQKQHLLGHGSGDGVAEAGGEEVPPQYGHYKDGMTYGNADSRPVHEAPPDSIPATGSESRPAELS